MSNSGPFCSIFFNLKIEKMASIQKLAPFQISEILICFFHSKIQPEISSYTKFRTILTGNDVTIKLFDFQRILLILIIYEPYK